MKKFSKGFTLIELLVVISIIGILASFLVVNYTGFRSRGRDAQRKSELLNIQSSLELYRSDSGSYPASLPVCGSALTYNGNTYMRRIPCDPLNASPYIYRYASAFSNSAYTLATCIENVNDRQKDSSNNPSRVDGGVSLTSCSGGTTNWSFTLFSP